MSVDGGLLLGFIPAEKVDLKRVSNKTFEKTVSILSYVNKQQDIISVKAYLQ